MKLPGCVLFLIAVLLLLGGCKSGPSRNDFLRATDKLGDRYEVAMTKFASGTNEAAAIARTRPTEAAGKLEKSYGGAAKDMQPLCVDLRALTPPAELKRLHGMECDFYEGQMKLLEQCAAAIGRNDWGEFDKRNKEMLQFLKEKMSVLADEFDAQHIDSSVIRRQLQEMSRG